MILVAFGNEYAGEATDQEFLQRHGWFLPLFHILSYICLVMCEIDSGGVYIRQKLMHILSSQSPYLPAALIGQL